MARPRTAITRTWRKRREKLFADYGLDAHGNQVGTDRTKSTPRRKAIDTLSALRGSAAALDNIIRNADLLAQEGQVDWDGLEYLSAHIRELSYAAALEKVVLGDHWNKTISGLLDDHISRQGAIVKAAVRRRASAKIVTLTPKAAAPSVDRGELPDVAELSLKIWRLARRDPDMARRIDGIVDALLACKSSPYRRPLREKGRA